MQEILKTRRPRNAKEFKAILQKPFLPGVEQDASTWECIKTSELFAALGTLKVAGKLTNRAFEQTCKFWSTIALPPLNYCPQSWHIVKKVLQITDPNTYKWSQCPCGYCW